MITVDDLIAEYNKFEKKAPEGLSIQQIQKQTGWTDRRIRTMLKELISQGKVTVSLRLTPSMVPGRNVQVPVYRLISKKRS